MTAEEQPQNGVQDEEQAPANDGDQVRLPDGARIDMACAYMGPGCCN